MMSISETMACLTAGYVSGFSAISGMLLSYVKYLYKDRSGIARATYFVALANILLMSIGVIFIIIAFIYREPQTDAVAIWRFSFLGAGIAIGMGLAFWIIHLLNKKAQEN